MSDPPEHIINADAIPSLRFAVQPVEDLLWLAAILERLSGRPVRINWGALQPDGHWDHS